jgi:hypothetical protein
MPHQPRTLSRTTHPNDTSHTNVSGPATRTRRQPRCPSDAAPEVDTWDVDPELTFLAWLADPDAPEELFPDERHDVALPVSWLLGMLCASRTPLPDTAGVLLGYRHPRTIGDAATDLLLAVSDPSGPKCPTFAAAKGYLRELDVRAHVFDGA